MRHSAKDGTQLSPHCFALLGPARNTLQNNRITFVAGLTVGASALSASFTTHGHGVGSRA